MRKNELELITALAEGTLEDESEARALVESSQELRAEYEAQKTAVEALRSVPTAAMSATEKAALRRDVWTELTAQPTAPAKTPWYYRWVFSGAAVVVVGIGLVAVLNQSGSDEAATTGFDEVTESLSDGEADSAAPFSEAGADEAQVETTEASVTPEDSQDLLTSYLTDRAAVVRSQGVEGGSASEDDLQTLAESTASCLEAAGLENYVAIAETTVDDAKRAGLETDKTYLLAIPSGEELVEGTPIAFVDSTECLVVHSDR